MFRAMNVLALMFLGGETGRCAGDGSPAALGRSPSRVTVDDFNKTFLLAISPSLTLPGKLPFSAHRLLLTISVSISFSLSGPRTCVHGSCTSPRKSITNDCARYKVSYVFVGYIVLYM